MNIDYITIAIAQTIVFLMIGGWLVSWSVTRFGFALGTTSLLGSLLVISHEATGIEVWRTGYGKWGDVYDVSVVIFWTLCAMLNLFEVVRNKQEADRGGPTMTAMQRALHRRHNNRTRATRMGLNMFDPTNCEDCAAENRYCGHGPELV